MNGNYLLDTNIVIALFNRDKSVIDNITKAYNIFIPTVVIGELYYGAYNSSKVQENVKRINEFQIDASIIDCNATTGNFYGQIKKELKDKGNPIPENDIWIAALTLQHDLKLVSRDKHFRVIDNLKLTRW